MQRILIIVLVLLVVLGFMVTYVVRFNEAAVVTTFGKADASSVINEEGLRFKWPYPFQKVITYDKRVRFIQAKQETKQTAEKSQVIVTSFLTWRVSDPLEFYKRFGGAGEGDARRHYVEAEKILEAKLRAAAGAVSRFKVSELISADESGTKLPALEAAMLADLRGTGESTSALSTYGIEPVAVGISGIGLPPETTREVFKTMKAARDKIANAINVQGTSDASRIRSEAENNATKIQKFAEQLAATIKSQGDVEAAQYLAQMKQDPQLAVFIQNMDFLRNFSGKRTTLVLPTWLPGFDMFRPDAAKKFRSGRPPAPELNDVIGAKIGGGPVGDEAGGAPVAGGSR